MPSEQSLRVIIQRLVSVDYVLTRIRGSHHVFTKPGRDPISIPVHKNKVKPVYVRKIQQIVEAEGKGGARD